MIDSKSIQPEAPREKGRIEGLEVKIEGISLMREISDLIENYGDGSPPSEAHGGGWEGPGLDGEEPALLMITPSLFTFTEIEMLTFHSLNLTFLTIAIKVLLIFSFF